MTSRGARRHADVDRSVHNQRSLFNHREKLTGSIEVGKAADLIVLSDNLFTTPEDAIHKVKVLLTLLDGAEVFRDPSFTPTRK